MNRKQPFYNKLETLFNFFRLGWTHTNNIIYYILITIIFIIVHVHLHRKWYLKFTQIRVDVTWRYRQNVLSCAGYNVSRQISHNDNCYFTYCHLIFRWFPSTIVYGFEPMTSYSVPRRFHPIRIHCGVPYIYIIIIIIHVCVSCRFKYFTVIV